MKRFLAFFLSLLIVLSITGCKNTDAEQLPEDKPESETEQNPESKSDNETSAPFVLTVDGVSFPFELNDGEAAEMLRGLLPLMAGMVEQNGNEKYCILPRFLPRSDIEPGEIHAGDIMLYKGNTLVLFYKDFSSEYSYTPLGKVSDPSGLAEALGSGNVTVSFSSAY